MKKCAVLFCMAVVCLWKAQAQTATVRQSTQAVKLKAYEVMDWTMLVTQMGNVAERTRIISDRYSMISKKHQTIEQLMQGDGIKNYVKMNNGGDIIARTKMLAFKVRSVNLLIINLSNMVLAFNKDAARTGEENSEEYLGVMVDAGASAGKAGATAGLSTVFDPTPMVSAINLLKTRANNQNIKRALFEVIYMVNSIDQELDKVYMEVLYIEQQITCFNRIGLMSIAPIAYYYEGGLLQRRKVLDARDAAKEAKNRAAMMKKMHEVRKSLEGKPIYMKGDIYILKK